MFVMITRPRSDADRLADSLVPLGVRSVIEPMFKIETLPTALDLEGAQAILITSANGARALGEASERRELPVLAVGQQSAATAHAMGFSNVAAADGDVAALAALVRRKLSPTAGKLVHVAGTVVAGDLSGTLQKFGYDVDRVTLYEARPVSALSPSGATALTENTLDGVLFFSPRTVHTFARLVGKADLASTLIGVTAYCLSPAVAAAASQLSWREIRTSARADQTGMIDLVRAGAKLNEVSA